MSCRASPWGTAKLRRAAFRLSSYLERRIVIMVEWVPREDKSLADELSKLIIPDD